MELQKQISKEIQQNETSYSVAMKTGDTIVQNLQFYQDKISKLETENDQLNNEMNKLNTKINNIDREYSENIKIQENITMKIEETIKKSEEEFNIEMKKIETEQTINKQMIIELKDEIQHLNNVINIKKEEFQNLLKRNNDTESHNKVIY